MSGWFSVGIFCCSLKSGYFHEHTHLWTQPGIHNLPNGLSHVSHLLVVPCPFTTYLSIYTAPVENISIYHRYICGSLYSVASQNRQSETTWLCSIPHSTVWVLLPLYYIFKPHKKHKLVRSSKTLKILIHTTWKHWKKMTSFYWFLLWMNSKLLLYTPDSQVLRKII